MPRSKRSSTSPPDFAEDELLSRARRLDRNALGELHDCYYPEMYRYAVYRLGNGPVCEDVVAEVFLRFMQALDQRRGPRRNLRLWLLQNLAQLVDQRLAEAAGLPRHPAAAQPSPGTVPPTVSEELLQEQRLRRALRRLPQDQQHYLALRFSQERHLDEISALLGQRGDDLRALQYRALSAFWRALEVGR